MSEKLPWHDDDLLWQALGPVRFTETIAQTTDIPVDRIVERLGGEPGARLLDLCCGIGRHSLEFARRGFRVTGVDRTESYLDQARRAASEEQLDVEFVREDMRRFRRPDAFDAAYNVYTSFGYFDDEEEDLEVLRSLHASLRTGGKLLMEMMGKEVLARVFRERDWDDRDGTTLLQERKVSRDWSWIENRWVLLRGRERKEFTLAHRVYSAIELRGALEAVGFRGIDVFGGLDGRPYDHEARRLVIVAVK